MRINNMDFNVQCTGRGETLIWAHGLTANMQSEDLLGLFEWEYYPDDRQLVRYDARGHGLTEPSFHPADYHWQHLARDMLAVADRLGIDTFIAGGQSMGCATTLYAGLLAPERVKGMILMNPPTAWETRAAQAQFYQRMARIGGLLGGKTLARVMARQADRLLPPWLLEPLGDDVMGMLEGIRPLQRRTLFNLFKGAALTDLPARDVIETIDLPTLILAWTEDQTHPVGTAFQLSRRLPQSTLFVAENYRDVQRFPGLIRDFTALEAPVEGLRTAG